MHIGIAFFTKNCLEYTQSCLASLETSHKYTVMVVDDFSSDLVGSGDLIENR